MSKTKKHRPAAATGPAHSGFNLQPKRVAIAVRWACQKIGQDWREREINKLTVS